MDILEWKPTYSVGVRKLDSHHKKLLTLIQDLDYSIRNDKGNNVGTVMNSLTYYTSYHFAEEEKLMEKYLFPDIEEHKERHRAFKMELNQKFDSMGSNLGLAFEVIKFLSDWLINHILIEDKKYSKYIPDEE